MVDDIGCRGSCLPRRLDKRMGGRLGACLVTIDTGDRHALPRQQFRRCAADAARRPDDRHGIRFLIEILHWSPSLDWHHFMGRAKPRASLPFAWVLLPIRMVEGRKL